MNVIITLIVFCWLWQSQLKIQRLFLLQEEVSYRQESPKSVIGWLTSLAWCERLTTLHVRSDWGKTCKQCSSSFISAHQLLSGSSAQHAPQLMRPTDALRCINTLCPVPSTRWRRSQRSTTETCRTTRHGWRSFMTLSWTMNWVRTPVWRDAWQEISNRSDRDGTTSAADSFTFAC